MIIDFVTGKLGNKRAERIIPNIKTVLNHAHESNLPVVYISDYHAEDDHEFSIWDAHAVKGTEGSKVIPELEPSKEDYTMKKTKYSAFYDTELDSLLNELKVDELVLMGVLTHICIQHTAADAFYRGYDIIIPKGCVEDISEEENQKAFDFMKENYRANIIDFKELMGE